MTLPNFLECEYSNVGRVPAMLNGCVGIKPTVGKVSTMGVIPACKSLDCVSCFARNVEDGALVIRLMEVRAWTYLGFSPKSKKSKRFHYTSCLFCKDAWEAEFRGEGNHLKIRVNLGWKSMDNIIARRLSILLLKSEWIFQKLAR